MYLLFYKRLDFEILASKDYFADEEKNIEERQKARVNKGKQSKKKDDSRGVKLLYKVAVRSG